MSRLTSPMLARSIGCLLPRESGEASFSFMCRTRLSIWCGDIWLVSSPMTLIPCSATNFSRFLSRKTLSL